MFRAHRIAAESYSKMVQGLSFQQLIVQENYSRGNGKQTKGLIPEIKNIGDGR